MVGTVCGGTGGFGVTEAAQAPRFDWVQATPKAAWQARDSSGEVVFRDRLWLLGGWFDSFQPAPRDVWSSADGADWTCVTPEAPWKHSDLPMTVTHNDRMWILGGWYNGRLPGHESGSEVWSSSDGLNWERKADRPGWSARLAAGVVSFKGRMWILGGTENYYFGDRARLKNDVWSSVDGKTWKLETEHAGWSPRAYHQAVAHAGRIWVMGGGNYVPEYEALNDVWSSEDGVHWERATEKAPWNPRLWFSSVAYRDHLWVIGGWSNNPSRNWGDSWYSANGRDWKQLQTGRCWKERHEHSAYVHRDRIWVAGGHAQPLNSEVWSLHLPENWRGD